MDIRSITISPTYIAVNVNGEHAGHATCRSASPLAPLRDRLWVAYLPGVAKGDGHVFGNPTAAADWIAHNYRHAAS